jgi:hypothetical protein
VKQATNQTSKKTKQAKLPKQVKAKELGTVGTPVGTN